jgi:hypothetical protein
MIPLERTKMASVLRDEDLTFSDNAPTRQIHIAALNLPAAQVFDNLANHPESWPRWFAVVRKCHYEGSPPFGVGARRRIALRGGILARETVLAWDTNTRFAFRVNEINLPGIRAFMEDWTVESLTDRRARVRWVLAADMSKSMELLFEASRAPIQHLLLKVVQRMESVTD